MFTLPSYHLPDVTWESRLIQFFKDISRYNLNTYFHPHPFDERYAKTLIHYSGKDLYFVQAFKNDISGYGMLRGWDQGFDIPSLGIVIHPQFQKRGFGKKFMFYLHEQARKRGAMQIRLKVYPQNRPAKQLYESLGYIFNGYEKGQIIGYIRL